MLDKIAHIGHYLHQGLTRGQADRTMVSQYKFLHQLT